MKLIGSDTNSEIIRKNWDWFGTKVINVNQLRFSGIYLLTTIKHIRCGKIVVIFHSKQHRLHFDL